jgi:hypothetical protein
MTVRYSTLERRNLPKSAELKSFQTSPIGTKGLIFCSGSDLEMSLISLQLEKNLSTV